MNCPNCGSETFANQQFCRSCGADLIDERPRPFNIRFWGILVLLMIFGGLSAAMGGKVFGVKWVIFAGVFVMMAGVFSIAAYGLLRQNRPRKRKVKPTLEPEPEALRADTTNKLLPIGDNDFIPTSVVENTTDLLKIPVEGRSRSSE